MKNMDKIMVLGNKKSNLSGSNPLEIKNLIDVRIRKNRTLHPYFTSQSNSLVEKYIETFSKENDSVLDPFCGSGVTTIESLILKRRATALDISPLACFITKISTTKINNYEQLKTEFTKIENHCKKKIQNLYKLNQNTIELMDIPFWYPKGIKLPENSDVRYTEGLFTKRNLIALSILKHYIENVEDNDFRNFFRLIFSGILHRASKTFFYDKSHWGGGNSGIFTKYRYWVPPKPDERNVWNLFEVRFKRIFNAKSKLDSRLPETNSAMIVNGTASNMDFIDDKSVDYIYTDPPYGANIAYLDLSTMWSAWLNFGKDDLKWLKFGVAETTKKFEVIEGGDINNSSERYFELLSKSLVEMYRILKYDSVISIAFCHKNLKFWNSLMNATEGAGFEYKNSYLYSSFYKSFHKIRNPLSVLSGQLVLNFKKVRSPKRTTINLNEFTKDPDKILYNYVKKIMLENNSEVSTETIINKLIPKLLENNMLHKYRGLNFINFLKNNFNFDSSSGVWTIK